MEVADLNCNCRWPSIVSCLSAIAHDPSSLEGRICMIDGRQDRPPIRSAPCSGTGVDIAEGESTIAVAPFDLAFRGTP